MGALILILGLYFNPLDNQNNMPSLKIFSGNITHLKYSFNPKDILFFADKEKYINKLDPNILNKLNEPALKNTRIIFLPLYDNNNNLEGFGIKISSDSKKTNLLSSQTLANSLWHIYLPKKGSFIFHETENFWPYIKNIIIPAHLDKNNNWHGIYRFITTEGPNLDGSGNTIGGHGIFKSKRGFSQESAEITAYSIENGPTIKIGNLRIVDME